MPVLSNYCILGSFLWMKQLCWSLHSLLLVSSNMCSVYKFVSIISMPNHSIDQCHALLNCKVVWIRMFTCLHVSIGKANATPLAFKRSDLNNVGSQMAISGGYRTWGRQTQRQVVLPYPTMKLYWEFDSLRTKVIAHFKDTCSCEQIYNPSGWPTKIIVVWKGF